ncbi:UNVERIFIED_CONTAM: hypothetical protein Sradi_0006300 [Sesamum radiatum]|uniref:Endonuclease/exonuclease/phosphatase domain-containing protein n=1 Tax=Sesamum radiatum TaxID=300843 RepID=A0AAW2WFU3_SESRA
MLQKFEENTVGGIDTDITSECPMAVGGDFNVILHPNENQGGDLRRMGPMDDFNEMMIDSGLVDAGFEGTPSPGPIKEFGKDWIEYYIPKNGRRLQHY